MGIQSREGRPQGSDEEGKPWLAHARKPPAVASECRRLLTGEPHVRWISNGRAKVKKPPLNRRHRSSHRSAEAVPHSVVRSAQRMVFSGERSESAATPGWADRASFRGDSKASRAWCERAGEGQEARPNPFGALGRRGARSPLIGPRMAALDDDPLRPLERPVCRVEPARPAGQGWPGPLRGQETVAPVGR